MDREREAVRAIETALPALDSLPKFHALECRDCGWTSEAWLMDEAEVRARVHREQTDGHCVEMQPVIAGEHAPEDLGTVSGGDDDR